MKKEWHHWRIGSGLSKWKLFVVASVVLIVLIGAGVAVTKLIGRTGSSHDYPWSQRSINAVLDLDGGNWEKYPDLKQEKKAIASTLDTFTRSLTKGDVEGAVSVIASERQGAYRELFNSRPEAMAGFAKIVAKAKMSFLSENYDPDVTIFQRTAEYSVTLDGFTFYIIFIKADDQWLLYDF